MVVREITRNQIRIEYCLVKIESNRRISVNGPNSNSVDQMP